MKSTSSTLKRLALAAAIACTLPMAAHAQGAPDGGARMHEGRGGHHMQGRHGHRGHGMGFLRGIKLTEAQRDRIFAIKHAQAPAVREKMKAVRKAHEDLRGIATSPQYDEARARAAADAGARAMADLTMMRIRTQREIFAVLTPEQRTQVEKNRAERKARMEQWRERGERGERGRGLGAPGAAPKQ